MLIIINYYIYKKTNKKTDFGNIYFYSLSNFIVIENIICINYDKIII
jgi:hypothetical protein